MIIQQKELSDCVNRELILLQCDYCNSHFTRAKRSVVKSRVITIKDCCDNVSCRNQKRQDSNIKKYGTPFVSSVPDIKAKRVENNIKKYGVSSPSKLKSVQEKKRKTCNERYGFNSYTQTEEYIVKRRSTCNERYGVSNSSKLKENRKAARRTCIERYGSEYYSQSEGYKDKYESEMHDKFVLTSIEKYGAEHYSQSQEFKDRAEEFKEKTIETNSEKYGSNYFVQSEVYKQQVPNIVKKTKNTCLEIYGVDSYTKTKMFQERKEEFKAKTKKTNLGKYGEEYYSQTEKCKEEVKQTCMTKYGVTSPLCLAENKPYGKVEYEIQDWINSFGFIFKSDRNILNGKELDLYDESKKIAIEYCGLYWHNELSRTPRGKDYHYLKYKNCLEQGIQLITIFEDEWLKKEEVCKSILKSRLGLYSERIQARKCTVREIPKEIGKKFYNTYHIQGSNRLGIVFFGLYHNDDLVSVLSLGRHHRNSKKLILDRFCCLSETQVIGGASKLFSNAINWMKANNYNSVSSWSDNRWSNGRIYEILGFVLDSEIKSDYSYVDMLNPTQRLSKQSQKKSNTKCPKETTEREWAIQHDLGRIWDCGKKRWTFNLKE